PGNQSGSSAPVPVTPPAAGYSASPATSSPVRAQPTAPPAYNPYGSPTQSPSAPPAPPSWLFPQAGAPGTSSYPQPRLPLMPPEWAVSGRDGTHTIRKVTDDGYFLILDDGSVWKSEDSSESDGWSDGDEVFVRGDMIINVSQNGKKIDADCEERG